MNTTIVPVGVDDLILTHFENQYPIPAGVSYNSYLVIGIENIVLIDAVDNRAVDDWLANIRLALSNGRKIDYLVIQHMEPDHSAGIMRLLDEYPWIRIVAGVKAVPMLNQFFPGHNLADRAIAVKDGDRLPLSPDDYLTFALAPMVHWPEVMVTYHSGSGTLFSADAFGTFGVRQDSDDRWPGEAARYYFNIVGKYGAQVQALLRKISALDIRTIAPLHGRSLEAPLDRYLSLYDTWSSYRPEMPDGVLVAYASIYGGTAHVAHLLADKLRSTGRHVVMADICRGDMSQAVSLAFRMGTVVLASVTCDASLMPAMRDFLNRLASKGWRDRRVAMIENGSWAPVAAKVMKDMLAGCAGLQMIEPVLTIRSRIDQAGLETLDTLTKNI